MFWATGPVGSLKALYFSFFPHETNDIKATYPEYIDDVGVTYFCNFENYFKDKNNLAFVRGYKYCEIPGFSVRHINEFEWLLDRLWYQYLQPIRIH